MQMTIEMAAQSARCGPFGPRARQLAHVQSQRAGLPRAWPTRIRMLIVDGRLPVGARLPSERALADTLRVSRTTVTAAYAQLRDDGYLNARRGARSTTALPARTGTRTRPRPPHGQAWPLPHWPHRPPR